jgi:hypothetical protein
MSVRVRTCPIMNAIARELFAIEQCPPRERGRMIARAVKAGKDAAEKIYGGFEMMEKYRENEKLKFENAELKKLNAQMAGALGRACHLCSVLLINRPAQCEHCKVYAALAVAKGSKQ